MRGCLAFVLFFTLVGPMLFAFEIVAGASTFLVNREFYVDLFADPNIYGSLLDTALAEAGSTIGHLGDGEQYEQVIAALDDGEWRAAVSSAVNQLFDVFEGKSNRISLTIPLRPLKSLLLTDLGDTFIHRYIGDLPVCRLGQEPTSAPSQFTVAPLPVCVPPDRTPAQYAEQIVTTLPQIVAAMPDQLSYSDTFNADRDLEAMEFFGGFSGVQAVLQGGVILIGIVALGAWLITGLIAAASMRGKLLALGLMLLLPSLAVLVIGFGIYVAFNAPDALPRSNTALTRTIVETLNSSPLSTVFLTTGAIPSAVAVGLIVLGGLLPSRRRDDALDDLRANPTTMFAAERPPASPSNVKLKNDSKPKNDDSIIRPL